MGSSSRPVQVARRLVLPGMLALTSAAPVHAQAPSTVTVSVDGAAAGTPLERVWPFHGFDEVNYTTSPEGTALLRSLANAHSAPVHVRSHFLLNNGDGEPALKWGSTNVYSEDAAGNPLYSWPLTDGILDAVTAAGTFPFVELGFMPEALSSHPTPYRNSSATALNGGCFYPPADYNKWARLISTWATHADARYSDVAANWLWELWNEPDLPYWHGTFDDYAKLYDYTESALHGAIPNAALGGPASAGSAFLRQFLKHCATGTNAVSGDTGTRLDLISFHAKGGVAIVDDHVQMDLGNQLRLHQAGFAAVAAVPQFKNTPIYITEADPDGCAACPVSTSPADAYRNSTAYGAYELTMMKHSLELEAQVGVKLGGLLTWAFTFPGTAYFAGYRALATNGINLPVLSAFELLGRLDGTRLPLTSSGAHTLDDVLTNGVRDQPEVDGMATRNGTAIQVLVWNYHDDLVSAPVTAVHLKIQVPASFGSGARISHLRVDELHGDAYTVWVSQGMPPSPSAAQVAALQQAMAPSLLEPERTVRVAPGGAVDVNFDLPRFGISLLTIVPASGADADPSQGASGGARRGGCAFRNDGRGNHSGNSAAWFGVCILALVMSVRRWNARASGASSSR
ncbi:MAG: beta-xylosidase [Polyangiaceae bacterium]